MVLGPIMKLVNGPTVATAISHPESALARLAATEKDDKKLIEQVFLRFLARYPTEAELQLGIQAMQEAGGDYEQRAAELAEYEKQLPAKMAAWEQSLGKTVEWAPLEVVEMKSAVGATLTNQDDGSIFVSDKNGKDTYTITAKTSLSGITACGSKCCPMSDCPSAAPAALETATWLSASFRFQQRRRAAPPKRLRSR